MITAHFPPFAADQGVIVAGKNEVLGHIDCETCGCPSSVMQARRKGAHLYTRCDNCGLDQRTGAAVQNRLFYRSEWIDRPPVIPENAGEPPAATEEVAPVLDSEPEPATDQEPKPEPKRRAKGVMGWIVAGVAAVGVAAAVVLNGGEGLPENSGGGNGFKW